MSARDRLKGLYAVTPDGLDDAGLLRACEAVLRGGARLLQYRSKSVDAVTRARQASLLRTLTTQFNALLFVNDDPVLAMLSRADGVHLGRDDPTPASVRAAYPGLLIGVSCYDSLDLACEACAAGADYLAFGAVAPSPTKPNAQRAPLALFAAARPMEKPLVAIGGITADNAAEIVAAGADALAVITAVFEHADPEAQTRALCGLFKQTEEG